jgi:hypothetical protein
MELIRDHKDSDFSLFWEDDEQETKYGGGNSESKNGGNVITNYFGNLHGGGDYRTNHFHRSNKIFIIPCENFDGVDIDLEIKGSHDFIRINYYSIEKRFSNFKFYFNLGDGTKCNLEINGASWIKDDYDPYMWSVVGTFAYMNFGMDWCWKSVDSAHDYIKGMLSVWNKYCERFYKKLEPLVDDDCGNKTHYVNDFLGNFHYIEDNEKLVKKYQELVNYYVTKYPDEIKFTEKDKLIKLMQLFPHMFITNSECITK